MSTSSELLDYMRQVFIIALKTAGPILIGSMALGIIIAIFQAATQIHEQTITFVPKLFLISVLLIVLGSNMLETLQEFTRLLFSKI